MSKFEFIIDGKTVSAEKGQTIVEIARANGIEIPTLCSNKKISKTTSCFVCIVKDLKSGRFLPSCSACPTPGQEIDASSSEVRTMRQTALNLLLSEHNGDCEAPCTVACPAHANVEEYVRAGRKGEFLESLKIIKQRIPLPMSIGRVCPRFCEKDCRKNIYGSPVAINDFKRLAADLYYDKYMEEIPSESIDKVAIVGGGPAGLSTAYFLRLAGVEVDIFDQMPKMGGMIRYGIPEYRLPKQAVLDREIAHFEKMGVKFNFNCKLGENLKLEDLSKNYDAVILATGCWKASSMRCEGDNLAVNGIDFLREVALNNNSYSKQPKKVIVVGGGNTAMDCVRTSVRIGAEEVYCFYRRTEAEMPAEKIEIHESREEGVKFEFLVAPVSLRSENGKMILTCQRMALGEADASGRRRPVPVAGSEFDTEADMVIGAIGQSTIPVAGINLDKRGNFVVNPVNMQVAGNIFACGDCVSGAATVVEAVGAARVAANGVVDFIRGTETKIEPIINVSRGHWQSLKPENLVFLRDDVSNEPRQQLKFIDLEERKHSFKEVCATMTPEQIMKEGERCIECSCTAKGECMLKKYSEAYGACPDTFSGEKIPAAYDNRHETIIRDRGKCIKCGVCVKICSEVINKSLFSLKKRGYFTTVSTAFDEVLPTSCSECGACIKECPVGALDWRIKK